ncbi:MAG: hypothetical protein QXG00_08665 [Candidatus Woesearchaeota archaeon]
MDVEKLKKINEMSKEFKKFGFSDDSLGAIKDVGKIYANKEEHDFIDLTPEKKDVELDKSNEVNPEIFKEVSSDYDQHSIESRELENLKKKLTVIEQFKVEQTEKMQQFSAQIDEMKNEFIILNNKIQELTNSIREAMIVERVEHEAIKEESRHQEKNGKDQKPGQYNERIGNYNSEDVSIEKMFYYGNR